MIYQVRANCYFTSEAVARGLYNHCKGVFPQAISVNPDSVDAEFSKIELIENHHDEHPHEPCFLLAGEITHPLGMPALPLELDTPEWPH